VGSWIGGGGLQRADIESIAPRIARLVAGGVLAGGIAMTGRAGTLGARAAADTITTRAGVHPEYGRIVFDWDRAVDFTATVRDGKLVVQFDRTVETSLADAILRLRDYVSSGRIEGDGRTVTFALKDDFDIRSFQSNQTKIVVDIVGPGRSANPAASSVVRQTANTARSSQAGQVQIAQSSGPRVPVRTGDHNEYSRLVFDWTKRVEYQIDRTGSQAVIRFPEPAQIDASAAQRRMPRNITGIVSGPSGNGIQISLAIPENSQIRHCLLYTSDAADE